MVCPCLWPSFDVSNALTVFIVLLAALGLLDSTYQFLFDQQRPGGLRTTINVTIITAGIFLLMMTQTREVLLETDEECDQATATLWLKHRVLVIPGAVFIAAIGLVAKIKRCLFIWKALENNRIAPNRWTAAPSASGIVQLERPALMPPATQQVIRCPVQTW